MKDDGEQLDAGDVGYVVYYTSATTEPTAEAVKAAGSSDTNTAGKVPVGEGQPKTASVTGKAFVHTVYMVLEAINNTDTSKTKLSEITKYAVTGLASEGTGTDPSITAEKGTTDPGTVQLTLADPGNWGTRDNGTPVDKKDVTFWLFYREGHKDKAAIIADIANAADLAAPDETKGVIQIAPPDTIRAARPFVVTRLKPSTQYSFFLRIIHPDTPVGTKANERTKYARDTAVAHGTSPPEGKKDEKAVKKPSAAKVTCGKAPWNPGQWCISTLATGFKTPHGIAAAKDGTAYVADKLNYQIKKITPEGEVSIIAGSTKGNADNPIGKSAQFNRPYGIALATDALYITDIYIHRIRKIALAPPHKVSTIAGSTRGNTDNPIGKSAQFDQPRDIAVAKDGKSLYVIDEDNSSIRQIALSGEFPVNTIRDFGVESLYQIDVTKDALYVASWSIRKITLATPHAISSIGSGFNNPKGISVAKDGTLYVADTDNYQIKQLTLNSDGSFEAPIIIAGSGKAGNTDGIGTTAQFNRPYGIAIAPDGNTLYVADTVNNSIRKLEYKAKEAEGEKP